LERKVVEHAAIGQKDVRAPRAREDGALRTRSEDGGKRARGKRGLDEVVRRSRVQTVAAQHDRSLRDEICRRAVEGNAGGLERLTLQPVGRRPVGEDLKYQILEQRRSDQGALDVQTRNRLLPELRDEALQRAGDSTGD